MRFINMKGEVKKVFDTHQEFTDYLENTLIPDLVVSKSAMTADNFREAVFWIRELQREANRKHLPQGMEVEAASKDVYITFRHRDGTPATVSMQKIIDEERCSMMKCIMSHWRDTLMGR